MSQETTQDLTQSQFEVQNDLQEGPGDDVECIATLSFEGIVRGEDQEIAIFPGEQIDVGRECHHGKPTPRKTLKQFTIHDGRVSKNHFRIYSIIYEANNSYDSQLDTFPPLLYCEDLESSNGTYVNGDLIGIIGKERVPYLLCDGDVIEIRPNWKFMFQQSNHRMIFPTSAQSRDMEHFVDRYTVSDRVLGSGHFGNVYLAKELSTNKQIACKVVDLDIAMRSVAETRSGWPVTRVSWRSGADSARKQRKKVLLEIEILSKLSHPNIVKIQKAFCSNSALYMFTDLAPAGDLYSYAQSHGGHVDDYNARVITKQITLALEYMHSQGIAHRDIKQENVLIASTDFGGRVMLTDFGFATYANANNGRMGRMMSKVGTEGFVAPEVENVERTNLGYTKAADLWSLGVLTASLLTGALNIPHEELSQLSQTAEIAERFLGIDDRYARHQWIQMPPRALRFVRKLLVMDPEERMTAAEALEHSWYTKPIREAQALDEGLLRINRFWVKRTIPSDKVLEALPGALLSSPIAAETPGPRFRRKIPDATSSPYFGLDRHLNQKAPSGRKRLLEDLNESGSPFLTYQEPQQPKSVADVGAQRISGSSREVSVEGTDLFGMSPLKDESQSGGYFDVNIIDLTSTVADHSSDGDDLIPMTLTHRAKRQFGCSVSSPIRSSSAVVRIEDSANRRFSSRKRYKVSSTEAKASDASSRGRLRYTNSEALRSSVRRMKL